MDRRARRKESWRAGETKQNRGNSVLGSHNDRLHCCHGDRLAQVMLRRLQASLSPTAARRSSQVAGWPRPRVNASFRTTQSKQKEKHDARNTVFSLLCLFSGALAFLCRCGGEGGGVWGRALGEYCQTASVVFGSPLIIEKKQKQDGGTEGFTEPSGNAH